MKNPLSDIHDFLREVRRVLDTRQPPPENREEQKFKSYGRFPSLPLAAPDNLVPLHAAWTQRSSGKVAERHSPAEEDLGAVLAPLRIRADGHRAHPSGGAKYPIETYVLGSVGVYKNSAFHYRPDTHALECLWPIGSVYSLQETFGQTVVEPTVYAVIFTAMWERTAIKYGDFGYQLVLLEAGHVAQNILLAAASVGVGARPFAGYNDEMIVDILDLDPGQEQPVYTIQIFGA